MTGAESAWCRAFGSPPATGRFPLLPEDFRVDEVLGFAPDGAGQHVLLQVQKRNSNTEWVARQLARLAGTKAGAVSYAGLKDRHALTTQWFSVDLQGRPEPDWRLLETGDIRILEAARHGRKLRRGTLRGNRFVMLVRDVRGDPGRIAARLDAIREAGIPNYFGAQRFGTDNVGRADAMFAGRETVRDRHRRGLYLSAIRALLFNRVLAAWVAAGTWDRVLAGDALALDGTKSFFVVDEVDQATAARAASMDVHPTGPLWGRGEPATRGEARALEWDALLDQKERREGLERFGCQQQRRALRAKAGGLDWVFTGSDTLELSFQLPAGSYATVLLREVMDCAVT